MAIEQYDAQYRAEQDGIRKGKAEERERWEPIYKAARLLEHYMETGPAKHKEQAAYQALCYQLEKIETYNAFWMRQDGDETEAE